MPDMDTFKARIDITNCAESCVESCFPQENSVVYANLIMLKRFSPVELQQAACAKLILKCAGSQDELICPSKLEVQLLDEQGMCKVSKKL